MLLRTFVKPLMALRRRMSGDLSGLKNQSPRVFTGFLAWSGNSLNRLVVSFNLKTKVIMKLQKILEILPAPLILSFILFCVLPGWTSASIVVAAFAFVGFKDYLRERRVDELKAINDEIQALKNRVEAIQISRSLGR